MTGVRPHSKEWYLRLSTLQQGYFYPWKSHLPPFNGEDVYIQMVHELLSREKDVLDAGCGHGELTLSLAERCRSILAYDRTPGYIELAEQARAAQGINNVRFVVWDSSEDVHGRGRLPAEEDSMDVLISRRGPINWLEDARRVGRPGAVLLQLNPMPLPPPVWNNELPEALRWSGPGEFSMRQSVTYALSLGGLEMDSCWTFEVPETFADPYELYVLFSWGHLPEEIPSYEEARPVFESIFERYGGPNGLKIDYGRLLWKAVVEK
jgi:SAM-dependent methyltransferase